MAKTLGGSIFVHNGITQDYCIEESIKCLQEFCDEVVIMDAGSTDGTRDLIYSLTNSKTYVLSVGNNEWLAQEGKWKLSHFTNMAISALGTDYNFNLQADEILHEKSYDAVRRAIETDLEAFMCTRINLWGNPNTMLHVEHHRQPCSNQIIRLAKTQFRSYDDAESLSVPCVYGDFLNDIRIYHMGFVRKREIHPNKIRHMQGEVFRVGIDSKLEGMDFFDPYKWFDKEKDLMPIQEDLPLIIQNWAKERTYDN